jgi:hypothetical protein
MIWYFENYKRHRREREVLELLAFTEKWLTPLGWRIDDAARLIWDADIKTPAGNRPVSLRYPNHFPYSPSPRPASGRRVTLKIYWSYSEEKANLLIYRPWTKDANECSRSWQEYWWPAI